MHPICHVIASAVLILSSAPAQHYKAISFDINNAYKSADTVNILDVDKDGDSDIFVATGGSARILINNGFEGFHDETATRLPQLSSRLLLSAAASDFDADGDIDFILGGAFNTQDAYLENDGTGVFRERAKRLPTSSRDTSCTIAADFDGDGRIDIAFGNSGTTPATVRVLLNNGTGDFSIGSNATTIPEDSVRAMAVGDFDADGDQDLAFARHSASAPYQQDATVFLNLGNGRFSSARQVLPGGAVQATDIAAGDFDRDGDIDLCLAYVSSSQTGPSLRLLRNDGKARFAVDTAALPALSFRETTSLQSVDYDGDGDLDFVTTVPMSDAKHHIVCLENTGRGRWTLSQTSPQTSAPWLHAAVGDRDSDGDLDFVMFGGGIFGSIHTFANLRTQIIPLADPETGKAHTIELWSSNSHALVLPFLSLSPSRIVAAPFGFWRLDPSTMIALGAYLIPVGGGHAKLQLPIPNRAALKGVKLHTQAVYMQSARVDRLSNALLETIR